MTENEARKIIVDAARSYLGFSEASGKHRKIIDIYDSKTPLPRNYRVTYSDPWCATFVSAMAIQCGMSDIIPQECSCYYQVVAFAQLDEWCENDAYVPKMGDIIYYDWQDDGAGDNTGAPDHVGIVESYYDEQICVIEGNKSDSVERRYIARNARYIRGFGLPDYAAWAREHTEKPKDEPWWIKDGSWQEATRLGLFDGNRPTANITRAEAAVVALRILKLAKGE